MNGRKVLFGQGKDDLFIATYNIRNSTYSIYDIFNPVFQQKLEAVLARKFGEMQILNKSKLTVAGIEFQEYQLTGNDGLSGERAFYHTLYTVRKSEVIGTSIGSGLATLEKNRKIIGDIVSSISTKTLTFATARAPAFAPALHPSSLSP